MKLEHFNTAWVYFFEPSDSMIEIQEIVDKVYQKMEGSQFSEERYCFFFYPGTYPIHIRVGFYTSIIGLGEAMEDVTVRSIYVDANWLRPHNALCNFTRSVENITVEETMTWATSQATYLRYVHVKKDLYLYDVAGCASGGFMAQCKVDGKIFSGPQQQYFLRNSLFQAFIGENWNMCFLGCSHHPKATWPKHMITSIDTTERIIEKPKLIAKNKDLFLRVFGYQENTKDLTGCEEYKDLEIRSFYIVREPKDLLGCYKTEKNLLFYPGIYLLDQELQIQNDRILFGIGFPTLIPNQNQGVFHFVKGDFSLCGFLLDGKISDHLIQIEESNSSNPSLVSDVFYRVGGVYDQKTYCHICLVNHRKNMIFDHMWIWRADHTRGVGWNQNVALTGVYSNGKGTTFYCLMVEHFQEYQSIFDADDQHVYFYQSESPYDCKKIEDYTQPNQEIGYASYYVTDSVQSHKGIAIGIYSVFLAMPILQERAIQVPENKNITLTHMIVLELGPNRGYQHILNQIVGDSLGKNKRILLDFPIKRLNDTSKEWLKKYQIQEEEYFTIIDTEIQNNQIKNRISTTKSLKKKMAICYYAYLNLFQKEVQYSEKEVTTICQEFYPFDGVEFRRDLIELGLLSRTDNGSRYWKE